jgi:DNA-binding SARP family transcriptional activator
MAGVCRVHLLGGFRVEINGRAVPDQAWRGRSGDLVTLLALDTGHHLTTAQVTGPLWPDASPRDAESELRKALKDARKAMGDGRAITEEGDRLRLWPYGELWVDAHTFAATAKHARNEEQRAAAAALYAGELLPRSIGPWAEPLRTRLRLMYLELLRDPDSDTAPWIDLRNPTAAVRS